MNDIKVDEGRTMGTAGAHRVLGGLWLVGAALTVLPAFMLAGASDHTADRLPGLVLGGLVLVGLAVGGWLVADPRLVALPASLGASLLWLVGGVAVYPTQDFAADALWAAGLPVLVAVTTGAVAGWVHRAERRAASF
jgi:hypothetical protein